MTVNITARDIEVIAYVQNRLSEKFDGMTFRLNDADVGPADVGPLMIKNEMLLAYKDFAAAQVTVPVFNSNCLGSAANSKYLGWTNII